MAASPRGKATARYGEGSRTTSFSVLRPVRYTGAYVAYPVGSPDGRLIYAHQGQGTS